MATLQRVEKQSVAQQDTVKSQLTMVTLQRVEKQSVAQEDTVVCQLSQYSTVNKELLPNNVLTRNSN
ncbi:hypothetical protein J6590_018651 [Homalodisca vitripennis]|nr:hypothetical protein J6590_018650 [Homalodisca vitripennis]KAG8298244.1 hypothetical protein J6590_018651 [Homalodisca vitripennis]